MSTKTSLTFILALPYSGSSLLALALGNAEGFINCGEMNYLENDWHEKRTCSCGSLVKECVFWGPVDDGMAAEIAAGRPGLRLEADSRLHAIDARGRSIVTHLRLLFGASVEQVYGAQTVKDYVDGHAALIRHLQKTIQREPFD